MQPRRRRIVLAGAAALAAAVLALGFVEYRYMLITGYHVIGFPPVRSPSLALDLAELAGLRQFYSQLGQDKWILGEVFPDVDNGYFVEVGSWDAVHDSNSKALEEAGWNGICIDPFPRNWKHRRCRLYREVVYSRSGETVEFRLAGILGGIDKHSGLWKDRLKHRPIVKLSTTTLGDLLRRAWAPEYIHYISIDVEGAELEVLRGFPFSDYRVGAFTIEHNLEEPKRSDIRTLLESHGYHLAREQLVDDWYVFAGNVDG